MIRKAQKGYLILVFFISPFLGLANLLKSKDEKFLTFFGTFFFGLIGSVFVYVKGTDGYSHLQNAKEYYLNMSFGEFFNKSFEILTFSSIEGSTDIYLHFISFISSAILGLPELIHVFAGFVLGYFFSKSVLLILKNHLHVKKGYILIGLIILLLSIKSIGALNSIRMWTGMWVLFYGVTNWALTKKRKYVYVILFSILVHFSYVVILVPVILSYFFRRRKTLMTTVYLISFIASISFSIFSAYIPKLDLLESKQKYNVIDSDRKADIYQARLEHSNEQNLNFYKKYGELNYVNYSIVGLSILLLFAFLRKEADEKLISLTAIGIGLYSFANFVAFSPSLQGRTKTIASLFILAAAIHMHLNISSYRLSLKTRKLIHKGSVIFLISALPMFLFQISDFFYNYSFFSLLFPQISWFLGDSDISIRTAIGILID